MNPGFQKITEARDAYKALVKSLGQDAVAGLLKDFLEKWPDVFAVEWDQYTPYFNDGDTCEFHVRECMVRLTEAGDRMDVYELEDDKVELKKDIRTLGKQLNDAEDILHECFGDHATVTVTRAGIDVSECSHD